MKDSLSWGVWAHNFIDRELRIIKFRGDAQKVSGFCEVRGIVNKDGTMSYGEYTQFDNEFGMQIKLTLIRFANIWEHAGILPWDVQGTLHQVRETFLRGSSILMYFKEYW